MAISFPVRPSRYVEIRVVRGPDGLQQDWPAKLRDARVAITALFFVLLGFGLAVYSISNTDEPVIVESDGTFKIERQSSVVVEALRDVGLSLIGVGAVGLVYEIINRQASEAALKSSLTTIASTIGHDVASEVTGVILGDVHVIEDVLGEERRRDLIQKMLVAHLDPAAVPLARAAATQLSKPARLEQFDVVYTAGDGPDKTVEGDNNTVDGAHASLHQRIKTNVQPQARFRWQMVALKRRDESVATATSEDIFVWRYWLAPDESDANNALHAFQVLRASVNGVPLTDIRLSADVGSADPDSVSWEASYQPVESDYYSVETLLQLPPTKEGSSVYFQPGVLSRGFSIRCDVTWSQFDAVTIDTTGATGVSIDTRTDATGKPTVTEVHTTTWVLPTAAVAFVFYKPTKPYNRHWDKLIDKTSGADGGDGPPTGDANA